MKRPIKHSLIENMLGAIKRQMDGDETAYILEDLSKKELKAVKLFLRSFDRPELPAVPVVTDEMVERAAKALEKAIKSPYEWTDEQFEVWWNSDPSFVSVRTTWGHFGGTAKGKCLWEARLLLEDALTAAL